jgi:cell shape-determining protein MreC
MLAALKNNLKLFLILFTVSVLLLLGDLIKILALPKSLLQQVTIPIQYGLYRSSIGISRQFEFVINARKASQENKALGEQLAQVLSENANLRKKLAEAQSFLDQEKTLSDQVFNLTPARPIGFSRYLQIDKGGDEGIKQNQVAVFKDNYIGRILEVEPKKSKIILVSDPDSRISAFSQSDSGRAKFFMKNRLKRVIWFTPKDKNPRYPAG